MGFFDFFKSKKKKNQEPVVRKLTNDELKWNKMWELWTEEKIPSPYNELMTYNSEVNNGGHAQFFDNIENREDIEDVN